MDISSSLIDVFNISSESGSLFFGSMWCVEFSISIMVVCTSVVWFLGNFFLCSMWSMEFTITVVIVRILFLWCIIISTMTSVTAFSMSTTVSAMAKFSSSFWSFVKHIAHEKITDKSKDSSDKHNVTISI